MNVAPHIKALAKLRGDKHEPEFDPVRCRKCGGTPTLENQSAVRVLASTRGLYIELLQPCSSLRQVGNQFQKCTSFNAFLPVKRDS